MPNTPTPAESTPAPRHCSRCDKSKWWHRVTRSGDPHPVGSALCHDGRPSPTFDAESLRPVYEALEHLERLDLPSPYEELTLFPAESLPPPAPAESTLAEEREEALRAQEREDDYRRWLRIESGQQ